MPWVAPAIMAAGAIGSAAISANAAGKGGASSTPSSMWQMMPGWAQDKYAAGMQAMPTGTNISFGGQTYPSMYGPYHRAATAIFPPQGANAQGAQPGGFGSALAAGMPWAMMAMNNAQMTNFTDPSYLSMGPTVSMYSPPWYSTGSIGGMM